MSSVRKRVLVTGGAGFLGSHLCERLIARGDDVLCVDNYFTGRKDNVAPLLGDPNFEAMRHDITHPLFVEVDEIYNLACPASPIHYQFDPVQTTKTSVIGAINMLGLAKRVKAKIFQASTSEVYGDPTLHPQSESYRGNVNPIGPRACYDEGKRCAETLFFDYFRQHNLRIRVARIFNTYGPRMHPNDGRVVSNFIVQALLLCRGSGRGLSQADGRPRRRHRSGEPRQPRRNLGRRARRHHHRDDRITLQAHPTPAPRRRPRPALPRHHPGNHRARLATQDRPQRGPRPHHRLFRQNSRQARRNRALARSPRSLTRMYYGLKCSARLSSLISYCSQRPVQATISPGAARSDLSVSRV